MQWKQLKLSSLKIKKMKHREVKDLAKVTWKIKNLMPDRHVPVSILLTIMLS